jgi:hypothetical protein
MAANLSDLLRDLQQSKFFGTLELRYESGHIVLAKRTESIKLAEDFRNHRGDDEHKSTQ